jgi:ABC-type nitrate/sulfonate/bicarbonate transport system permease component
VNAKVDRVAAAGRLLAWAGVLAAFNLVVTLAGLWRPVWWLVALVDFALLVPLAETGASLVPPRWGALYSRALAVGFPLLLLAGWELVVRAGILSADWFPPPTRIASALWDLATKYDEFNKTSLLGRPWLVPQRLAADGLPGVAALAAESHLLATLERVFLGFLIGAAPGIVLGVVMGVSRTVRTMIDATLSAFYVLPKIAIFPIMMLVFPNPFGEGPKIAVVAISAFFLVTINTMVGVRDIDPVYIEAGRNYGANRWQMFRHVIVPGAMPVIFAGLRLALGTALIVIIAIEFVRAKTGVGFLTFYYWEILAPDKMYAGLVVVMILGVALTAGLKLIERLVMPWSRERDIGAGL